jgi:hypothetical protein
MPLLLLRAVILFSIAVALYTTRVWMLTYVTGVVSDMQNFV